ncbi:uncharacterized protein E0L32_004840 [Thyridium curvatum]|uniref:Uncharacterized protein n=1 Tax=Thyridium curvatum TaxID=1093900 RepID=A0A507BEQ2_9PEZI|nr:uncharacterized protein E0L32_004840 [Thyridium curvatum]TPX15010.1 hypothetical protein E0L32_004840 [Thyridium curvatum]
MSAPPSGLPNGRNPPSKGPAPLRRKPRPADPLVARKKPIVRPQPGRGQAQNAQGGPSSRPQGAMSLLEKEEQKRNAFELQRRQNGGWTDPMPPQAHDYPLVTTKRELREGIRYHVMRLASAKANRAGEEEKDIDPTNQDEFTRPVSLHRRDPRQPAPGRVVKEKTPTPPPPTVDEKEAERLAQIKAEREAQRASDLAQIAPVAKEPHKQRQPQQKKEKPVQAYYPRSTAEQKKESEIRYEESLPWHLEDADGKNVWVGHYISALSEANVAFVISGNGFRMIPLEKYYRFTPKPPFQAYTIEEAEKLMDKKFDPGRWVMREKEKAKAEEEYEATRIFTSGRARVKTESSTYRSAPRSEKVDHDDLDFEGDEFQDDDENVGLEPDNDEDARDARERMRRNHLGANLFGEGDEKEVEKQEIDDLMAELKRKLDGKKLRKALAKREDALEYESDSDESNPFGESSSSEDEAEKDEEEQGEEKKDEDSKDKLDVKLSSGAASKGNTTPSGKHRLGDAKKGKSLKRPGSPNLSESSGNESSRKKVKKHATGSVQPSRSSTPLPGQQRSRAKGGALSDGEATAGEMSDGGVTKKKIKIIGTGARGTPVGSRAGSPVPSQGAASVSPTKGGASTPRATSPPLPVQASEIVNALIAAQPDGIQIGSLLRQFGNRVGDAPGQMPRKDWIKLVKDNAVLGEDRMLRPKPAAQSP